MKLFQPNNHSEWRITSKETPDAHIIKEVVQKYYLLSPHDVKLIDEANVNSINYIIELQDGKKILLRRYKTLKDKSKILLTHRLLLYLYENGAQTPVLLKTLANETLIEHDNEHWCAFEYFPSNHFAGTLDEIKDAARAIAKVHILLKGCPFREEIERTTHQLNTYTRIFDYSDKSMQPVLDAITQKKEKDEINEFVIKNICWIHDRMRNTFEPENLPSQIIHSDLHPHNILCSEGRIMILDFDAARPAQRARDVSFALFRLIRQLACSQNNPDAIKKAKEVFLEEYNKINPLTSEELRALVPLMYDEICKKMVYVLSERYLENDFKWSQEIPKFAAFLKEIEYFEDKRDMKRTKEYLEQFPDYIPGGANTLSKFPVQFVMGVSPAVITKGDGCYVWDIDGNRYIEMGLALGPMTLGYNVHEVNDAVKEQIDKGTIFLMPHEKEIELAKTLCKIVPCAQRVRFFLNGGDATSAGIRAARAYTGRSHLAKCGYHGWHDWSICTKEGRNKGVPEEVKQLTHDFKYNYVNSLREILQKYSVAAVILEPANITEPEDNFLKKVKELAEDYGSVLIFDEIVTGFRWDLGGAQKYYGVTPDLCTMGKGMSNGFPISVIMGKAEIMDIFKEVFCSVTYAGYAPGVVGAIKTINIMKRESVHKHIWNIGNYFINESNRILDGLPVRIAGLAPHPMFVTDIADELKDRQIKSLFIQELNRRGVLAHTSMLIGYAHKKEHIDFVLQQLKQTAEVIRTAINSGDIGTFLHGPVIAPRARKHV